MFKKNYLKVLLVTLVMALFITGCSSTNEEPKGSEGQKDSTTVETEKDSKDDAVDVKKDETEKVELIVYAGAGLKKAMEQIKPAFEAKENVEIQYIYAGSGQLLSQIETSGKGDVLLVGSEDTYNIAKEKGQANDSVLIAHHTPAIAVQKGNPMAIASLKDLTKEGVKVALGDEKANAVGKTAAMIIEKNGLQDIKKNVVTTTATVNELVVAVSTGEVDAAIVTEDSIRLNEDVEMVEIPESENIDQLIPAGTLTSSKHPELAQKLVDFIASEEGKAIFEKSGYRIIK